MAGVALTITDFVAASRGCRVRRTSLARPSLSVKTARPPLQALYKDTFAKNKPDAIVFPTVPKVAIAAQPDSSSLENFLLFIQNTDPGSNAGVPGIQIPVALGAKPVSLPV